MQAQEVKSSDSILDLTATEMAQKIKTGELSSQEVVEAHIKRIESVNKKLNAVIIKLYDSARAQAIKADKAVKEGKQLGPLHGVPITIKEQFEVAGTQLCLGVSTHTGKISKTDGPLVARLRSAGAIILGKTNIPVSLYGWEADNPVYGTTNNPWNQKRTPGGSSGGEGAIIAARGSPMGLGGDFGGSIRIPSHFSGIHGLKPTSQRLTNVDTPSYLFSSGQNVVYPQPGPMARSVADLKLMMKVLADPPVIETPDFPPPVPWPDPDKISMEGLKVGMYTDNGHINISPAIKRAINESAAALKEKGAVVKPFTPYDLKEALMIYIEITASGGNESIPRTLNGCPPPQLVKPLIKVVKIPGFMRGMIARGFEKKGDEITASIVRSAKILSSEEYWKLVERFHKYRWRFMKEMDKQGIDAFICPPFATVATQHGGTGDLGVSPGTYVMPYNLLGIPAGVVSVTRVLKGEEIEKKRQSSNKAHEKEALKIEQGSTGMPVGVQVAARHWREDIVLKVMETLEEHFSKKPTYPLNHRFNF
jgi:fatty acid amide hydrolase